MLRWLLPLAVFVVFVASFGGALAVKLSTGKLTPQVWSLAGLAVAFVLLLGLIPRLAKIEARLGPFLCYATGLLLSFLYSTDLSRISASSAKLVDVGLIWLWLVFGVALLCVVRPAVGRASSVHAWLLLACLLGWVVAYFSGDAGSGGSWIQTLAARLGWDLATAERAVLLARKSAHFLFYGTVAAIGWALARAGAAKRPSAAIVALGMALIHALFDEGRQSTAIGRSGSAWDVALDFAGALAFVAIAWTRAKK